MCFIESNNSAGNKTEICFISDHENHCEASRQLINAMVVMYISNCRLGLNDMLK